ncbi:MAG: GNAT family N-acetyltransferase [Chloroflexi bacterium]|nr:GNAT family N-acetyltransferase [Chloroflexota bacterium]
MAGQHLWVPRQATPADQRLVDTLLAGARWRHAHLDWLDAVDLLGQSPFLLATDHDRTSACLACPPDPPGFAWIRVFASGAELQPAEAWACLWPSASRRARLQGASLAAALSAEPWMVSLLRHAGFEETNGVVFLEHRGRGIDPLTLAGMRIRSYQPGDIDALLDLDQQAFPGLWGYSLPVLTAAIEQAALVTVLEAAGEIVGYQLSTASALGAHLARLAVAPQHQGQGYGSALVRHLLHAFSLRGFDRVSVNTQVDNRASLTLYRRLGFADTGQAYPVFTTPLTGSAVGGDA